MEKLIRFLSGEVPGGIGLYIGVMFVIIFMAWFLYRFSAVINKQKLKRIAMFLCAFATFTYLIARLSRPPQEETIYIAVWPLQYLPATGFPADSGEFAGLGRALAELTAYRGMMTSPDHMLFLKPDWLLDAFDSTDRAELKYNDTVRLTTWCRTLKINYMVSGSYSISGKYLEINADIYSLEESESRALIRETLSFQTTQDLVPALENLSAIMTKGIYKTAGMRPAPVMEPDLELYRSPALLQYGYAQELFSRDRYQESLAAFNRAHMKDSSRALTWFGKGLAYGELMIRTSDDKLRNDYQKRAEYHLKMCGQKAPGFAPAYVALAKYYLFMKPEPRYLDAEFALIAGKELYARDYMIYYLLSFMQKIRWESFGFTRRQDILAQALQYNPAAFQTYLEYGFMFLQYAKPHDYNTQQALQCFRTAKFLRPNHLNAIMGLVSAYDYMGYYDEALKLLEQADRLYPNHTEIFYTQGVVHYHQAAWYKMKKRRQDENQSYRLAEQYFQRAVKSANHGYAFLYLGKIYDIQNRKNEAIEAFRAAMKYIPREDPYREEARKKLREYFPDVE